MRNTAEKQEAKISYSHSFCTMQLAENCDPERTGNKRLVDGLSFLFSNDPITSAGIVYSETPSIDIFLVFFASFLTLFSIVSRRAITVLGFCRNLKGRRKLANISFLRDM